MTDEEKKAIKEAKHFANLSRYWRTEEYEEEEITEYIKIILNLIEKQQKEIEYLKGIAKKFNEGTDLNDTEMDYIIKIYERKNND